MLFLVSVFIIANTIKLTAFDRREDIAIMKMVCGLYSAIAKGISGNDIFSIITIVPFADIWQIVALVFVAAGMLIGVGGSLSAIRQFLKV